MNSCLVSTKGEAERNINLETAIEMMMVDDNSLHL